MPDGAYYTTNIVVAALKDTPADNFIQITVKRETAPKDHPDAPVGVVSSYLLTLSKGDVIKMGACFGSDAVAEMKQQHPQQGSSLSLSSSSSSSSVAVLVSAGIGIAFSASILDNVSKEYQSVHVYHEDANAESHALRQTMEQQAAGKNMFVTLSVSS